jgi:hypothetical protein
MGLRLALRTVTAPGGKSAEARGTFYFFGLIVASRPARDHLRPSMPRGRPGRPYEHLPHPASPRR